MDDSLQELRDVSRRITEGLDQVISVLEEVSKTTSSDSINLADEEELEAAPSDDGITDLVQAIRDQVQGIAQLGADFEEKITKHASELVEMKQQLEETKRHALIDPLTEIANRRKFEDTLETLLTEIADYNGKLAVLLADIDNFKTVNDKLGHHVGDQVLRLVANTFLENLKGLDTVARWGGDEFTAVLPNTTAKDAKTVAEKIRQALSSKNIINKVTGEKLGKITLSIGGATYLDNDTMLRIMDRADKALYAAKQAGRNRVIISEEK